MTTAGYYRFPTIHNDTVVFVSEDDLWTVPTSGGITRRLTSNLGEVTYPMLSPDGSQLAFVGREEGSPEVYVMPADGGSARRLTYLSSYCRIVGWNPAGSHIIFTTTYGQATRGEFALYQVAVDSPNGSVESLSYGPARSIAFGPNDQLVLGRNTGDPALWKRYRGGTAGHLWIRRDGSFEPFLAELKGNIASPMWLTAQRETGRIDTEQAPDRIFFVSDHEGVGNLYSCTVVGDDLQRHTDHEDYYVRNPSSDGRQIVYHVGADLYVYTPSSEMHTGVETRVNIDYRSPRVQRNRKFVNSSRYLSSVSLNPSGAALAVNIRGKSFSFYNHDGPVYQHGKRDGVRYRLIKWLNDSKRLVIVSDAPGEEILEIHSTEPDVAPRYLDGLDLGRPVSIKVSPVADKLAIVNHRHELLIVDLSDENIEPGDTAPDSASTDSADEDSSAEAKATDDPKSEATQGGPDRITVVDHSPYQRIRGFDWSPDGRWLAYGYAATTRTTEIRLYRLPDPEAEDETLHQGSIHTITKPVLHDLQPAFDPDGKYLYFLSYREFNPVYDTLQFDLGFPWGMRPYLITLQADLPDPFTPHPELDAEEKEKEQDNEEENDGEVDGDDESEQGEDEEAESGDEELTDEEDDDDSDGEDELEEDELDEASSPEFEESGSTSDKGKNDKASDAQEKEDKDKESDKKSDAVPPITIDLDGIERRVMAFPVPDGRYSQIAGVSGKAIFITLPVRGTLDNGDEWDDEQAEAGTLRAYNFKDYKSESLVGNIYWFTLSQDHKKLAYLSGRQLRVIGAGDKAPGDSGGSRRSGWINSHRIKVSVDPQSEWEQMLREAWRLQRDHFWSADMSQVDWQTVYQRYLPLVERVSSRSEFSDLLWEMQGELGTSHAYEYGGDYRGRPYYGQGFLGTQLTWNPEANGYEVGKLIVGDSWKPRETSPLTAPGVDIQEGDVIVAINRQPVDEETSPAQLLVNQAGHEVSLTLLPRVNPPSSDTTEEAGNESPDKEETSSDNQNTDSLAEEKKEGNGASTKPRQVTVRTLYTEAPARYREWVNTNRERVHEASDGRIGYVHIPDMSARGYAEFHRGFLAEINCDGLIVDVRYNGGGHVSELILEKLARRRIGYELSRWGSPVPYPSESLAGPMVALTNEHAASDGDIFCHSFKLMKLGPLVGKRTWGGVIGIFPRHSLIDGTITTQPEYGFWFEDVGWNVENYGTDPDIEVDITPQDYAEGKDPQLERAIEEALSLLENTTILKPNLEQRPSRALPKLPPRRL